ncbi:MAG: gamma-glutamyl-gamma-aminobutyrate hydrolase family protein [bacterium]|nr:gamma-glutamyl-gamma-aminobutyrate hydrolase family protein [bacterium]
MKIAVSKASGSVKYGNYGAWLRAADPEIEIVDCIGMTPEQAVLALEECDGLVLSGGADVEPERYGQPEKRPLCHDCDPARDVLEIALVKAAVEMNMPVLGICRGAQIMNVAYGGTLVADLPTAIGLAVEHRTVDGHDGHHAIEVEPGSLIKRICRVIEGEVNTAHHQAVERLAPVFAPSAMADDGTIEAFEAADATLGGRPFILAVQWHPERMEWENPLSMNIAVHFVNEAHAFGALVKGTK